MLPDNPRVTLVFQGQKTEADAGGGFEGLLRQAEASFGLAPGSFGLTDPCGKVDASNLSRALAAAGGGPCLLDVAERAEWARIRALEARLDALVLHQDERIAEKVDAALALRYTAGAGAPGSELKVGAGVAALVESLADQVAELKAYKFAEPVPQANVTGVDAGRFARLEEDVARLAAQSKSTDSLPACQLDTDIPEDLQTLLGSPLGGGRRRLPTGSAARSWGPEKGALGCAEPPASFSFGAKAARKRGSLAQLGPQWAEQAAVPFVRLAAVRPLDRGQNARSMPHLPPVQ